MHSSSSCLAAKLCLPNCIRQTKCRSTGQPVGTTDLLCGRARKPFHPQKLYDFIVRHFLLQQVALVEDADGECDGHNHKVKVKLLCTAHCCWLQTTSMTFSQAVCTVSVSGSVDGIPHLQAPQVHGCSWLHCLKSHGRVQKHRTCWPLLTCHFTRI